MPSTPPRPVPPWRNRIKELRYVSPRDLDDHPLQWRTHPDQQRAALRGVLDEVGIAGALLAYEDPTTGRLISIDGHLRKSLGDTPWPTLILDVTAAEANLLLATHDPLAALAETSREALTALLETVQSADVAVQDVLADLAAQVSLPPLPAPHLQAYAPMLTPESQQRQVTEQDLEDAAARLQAKITDQKQLVSLICPHCYHEFSIDPATL